MDDLTVDAEACQNARLAGEGAGDLCLRGLMQIDPLRAVQRGLGGGALDHPDGNRCELAVRAAAQC